MEAAGLWMLAAVAMLMAVTGLPAFMSLLLVGAVFAAGGIAADAIEPQLLMALPSRMIGLLENDLLQAIPLYVFMGILLYRLPLADRFFGAGLTAFRRTGAAPQLSALLLGGLLATKNGSVGASIAALSRIVLPRLRAADLPAGEGLALICVAATLGVLIPPSLVLILLGDAMMTAHTVAQHAIGGGQQIINTRDVFRGALGPAGLFAAGALALCWWQGRRRRSRGEPPRVRGRDWIVAMIVLGCVIVLLAGVALGYFYAVEAAAMGGVLLLAYGLAGGHLDRRTFTAVAAEAMVVSGALFALFAAATCFTLIVRAFGTDQLLARLIAAVPGQGGLAMAAVMAVMFASAFVLDAFEIVFVLVPLLMPPLLERATDAVWVSTLTLLTLQASFLIPPFGYAVMMARAAAPDPSPGLARALAPFLLLQALVLGATFAFPGLSHWAETPGENLPAPAVLSDEEVAAQFRALVPPPPPPPDE